MPHVPRRPRGVLIAVMLLASLLLAGLLAFQAQRTFLHHRASAERVLRDYARLAASRFALRTGANLYYMAAWPPMEALLHTRSEDTRLNSSHSQISYAVFCLKKKRPRY